MNKVLTFLAATLFVVLSVSLISTGWVFIPALIANSDGSYLINQALFFLIWAALVTGIIVLVIGIPVYLALDIKGKASQVNLALAGFMIPVIIMVAIIFLTATDGNSTFSTGSNYHGTYRDMIVKNERTLWGWISLVEQFLTYGFFGLIGATIFGKTVSILNKPDEKA